MKAISIHEPYASLIRTGAKTFEIRFWATKYRGLLLICAAKARPVRKLYTDLSYGHIQRGLRPLLGKPLDLKIGWPGVKLEHLNFGKAVAIVEVTDCIFTNNLISEDVLPQTGFGDFHLNRFAWKLKLITEVDPFPVKGHQGFFNVRLPEPVISTLVEKGLINGGTKCLPIKNES